MQFLDYLNSIKAKPQEELNALRDAAALKQQSLYEYIYERCGTEEEIFPYNDLIIHFKNSLGDNDPKFFEMTDTNGWAIDEKVYKLFGGISEHLAHQIIPLVAADGEHRALIMKPDDPGTWQRISLVYRDVDFKFVVTPPNIRQAIWAELVEPMLIQQMATQVSGVDLTETSVSDEIASSTSRSLYAKLINKGIEKRASDIHFIPCTYGAEVHYRVDGVNRHYLNIQLEALNRICEILKSDGQMAVKNPWEPIDGKVRFSASNSANPNDQIDLRVSIIPTKGGPDLNIRYLSEKLYTFEELGMSEHNIAAYRRLLELPSGLVVQVGPTGSGKSTTLYAGLAYVHKSLRNIITAEDPVEILMDGISQIDVEDKKRLTFADALKASLRHDPDVVVVGELRDPETAALAIRAANTGHLVLTSLHTNDSIGAIERLVNLEVDPYSLGEVMAAVMGQRLVRRLCPHCREKYQLDLKSTTARMFGLPNREGSLELYRARGCVHCDNTGYHGRIAINEIMSITPEIRDLIQQHAPRKEYEATLRAQKFRTMYQDGIAKVLEGVTSLEEMEKFARDTIAFKG